MADEQPARLIALFHKDSVFSQPLCKMDFCGLEGPPAAATAKVAALQAFQGNLNFRLQSGTLGSGSKKATSALYYVAVKTFVDDTSRGDLFETNSQ